MKKHLIEIFSGRAIFSAETFVTQKEGEGWELITPIQVIQPRQSGPHYAEAGYIILTFEKEVQE